MLIQLTNLPAGTTYDDINDLLDRMSIIDKITLVESENPDNAFAWIELKCSRVGLNAICEVINGRYINGQQVSAYPSLYSH